MAFRMPGFDTVATTAPRFLGSFAPHSSGSGSTPKLDGCVVSLTRCLVFGCRLMPLCLLCRSCRRASKWDGRSEQHCRLVPIDLLEGIATASSIWIRHTHLRGTHLLCERHAEFDPSDSKGESVQLRKCLLASRARACALASRWHDGRERAGLIQGSKAAGDIQ